MPKCAKPNRNPPDKANTGYSHLANPAIDRMVSRQAFGSMSKSASARSSVVKVALHPLIWLLLRACDRSSPAPNSGILFEANPKCQGGCQRCRPPSKFVWYGPVRAFVAARPNKPLR